MIVAYRGIISGKFSFPSMKEGLKQRKDEKRKQVMLDTSVVDNHLVVVLSGPVGSSEPSQAKSSKKNKSSEVEECVRIDLPCTRSAYSNPSFVKNVANSLSYPC